MASREIGCRERILRLRRAVLCHLSKGDINHIEIAREFDREIYELDMETKR